MISPTITAKYTALTLLYIICWFASYVVLRVAAWGGGHLGVRADEYEHTLIHLIAISFVAYIIWKIWADRREL